MRLRGADLLKPPDADGGEAEGGHEVFDVTIEAGCDTSLVFEAAEHAFDDVSLFVDRAVVVILDLAVLADRVPRSTSRCVLGSVQESGLWPEQRPNLDDALGYGAGSLRNHFDCFIDIGGFDDSKSGYGERR